MPFVKLTFKNEPAEVVELGGAVRVDAGTDRVLLAALAGQEGATTGELAAVVHRRRVDVIAALGRLEAAGLVERVHEPHGRAWNRSTWRVTGDAVPEALTLFPHAGTRGAVSQVGPGGGSGRTPLSGSGVVSACRMPDAHRRWWWRTSGGRELCGLCVPPAVSTALRVGGGGVGVGAVAGAQPDSRPGEGLKLKVAYALINHASQSTFLQIVGRVAMKRQQARSSVRRGRISRDLNDAKRVWDASPSPRLDPEIRGERLTDVVRFRLARAVATLLTAGLLAALSLGAASATPLGAASASKTCSPGYVYANLSWGEKCLRAGQFCKVGNPEYHAYGFDCPPSGRRNSVLSRSDDLLRVERAVGMEPFVELSGRETGMC